MDPAHEDETIVRQKISIIPLAQPNRNILWFRHCFQIHKSRHKKGAAGRQYWTQKPHAAFAQELSEKLGRRLELQGPGRVRVTR
jgi:hypothetical protein